jgi:hypothetical protein
VGLFHRSDEDSGAVAGATGPSPVTGAAGPSAAADQIAAALDGMSGLSLPERAAELLRTIAPAIEQTDDYLGMRALLARWLPDSDWMSWSPEQRATWSSLELVLQEAFQVLVLTRMLIRRESSYKGATDVTYALGPDARAAQGRGDVAEVVTRRLPD